MHFRDHSIVSIFVPTLVHDSSLESYPSTCVIFCLSAKVAKSVNLSTLASPSSWDEKNARRLVDRASRLILNRANTATGTKTSCRLRKECTKSIRSLACHFPRSVCKSVSSRFESISSVFFVWIEGQSWHLSEACGWICLVLSCL